MSRWVLPQPHGTRAAGIALRVPTPNVSVVDLVIQVEKKTFAEEVNSAFREAAAGAQQGVLAVSDLPLVSKDFALSDVSTTIDASLTMVMVRARPPPAARRCSSCQKQRAVGCALRARRALSLTCCGARWRASRWMARRHASGHAATAAVPV